MDSTTKNKIQELKKLNEQSEPLATKAFELQKKLNEIKKNKLINKIKTNTERLVESLKPWMEALEVCNLNRVEIPLFDFYKIFLTKTSIEVDKYFSFSNDKWIAVEYIDSDNKDRWVEFWTRWADPTDLFEMPLDIIEDELERELIPTIDDNLDSKKKYIIDTQKRCNDIERYIAES